MPLSHSQIWMAIDALAARHGFTASGLARRAGLDSTTFNRSKRVATDGRLRWPSTESIAKILDATGASVDDFMAMMRGPVPDEPYRPRAVPLIGMTQAGGGGFFDDGGFPVGAGWEEISVPDVRDENAYALEISGDSMLPLYRAGDVIIVSPGADIRRGDRVVAKTRTGEVMAKILARRSDDAVELHSLNPAHGNHVIPLGELEWIARIVWASQ